MLNPKDLEIFCKVADAQNMTRVAQAEAKSTMAVSKQIARLEAALNQALFLRTRKKLVLTGFGQAFKQKAERLIEQHYELLGWTQSQENEVSGELKILCQSNQIASETLVPWVAEFLELYPKLSLTLDVKESLISIREDDYDIFWGIGAYLGDRFGGLKRRSFWKSQYGVFASPSYINKHGLPSHIDELYAHEVIGYLYNEPSNVLVLQNEHGEPVYTTPKCRVKTVVGLIELAESGLGLINAPLEADQIQSALSKERLLPVLQSHWLKEAEAYIYFHPSKPIQSKVRACLDFFIEKRKHWG
jgi:DNA-binding transcriptional LysR family regulator